MVSLGGGEIHAVASVIRQNDIMLGLGDDRDKTRGFSVAPRILENAINVLF